MQNGPNVIIKLHLCLRPLSSKQNGGACVCVRCKNIYVTAAQSLVFPIFLHSSSCDCEQTKRASSAAEPHNLQYYCFPPRALSLSLFLSFSGPRLTLLFALIVFIFGAVCLCCTLWNLFIIQLNI